MGDVMRMLCSCASMALLLLLAGSAHGATPFVDGELLVAFHPGTPAAERRAAHALVAGSAARSIPAIGVIVVSVDAGRVPAALQAYRSNPNVVYAEPNYKRPLIVPTEGQFSDGSAVFDDQWSLHNAGSGLHSYMDPSTGAPGWLYTRQDADIDATEAWDVSQGRSDVWVAVLDSGVDCGHGDLAGKCVHIEDHVTPTVDMYGSAIPELVDRVGHGTHVAGTIAMATDNDEGGAGIGWNVSVGSFKVCYQVTLLGIPVGSDCEDADIAAALVAAADYGYHVVNMSFGGDASAVVQSALDYAAAQGVVLVAASGNDGSWARLFPAAYPNVISVGASTPYDDRASFSSFSVDDDHDATTTDDDWVDLLAPGTPILSTVPQNHCSPPSTQCFGWKDGTSMAAPHVSGVAALVWSHLLDTEPAIADSAEVRRRIQDCADATGAMGQDMRAWSRYGRLNAHGALTCGATPPPPPPPPSGDPVPPVHVADLEGLGVSASGPTWTAQVTISVHDSSHAPVEGADVAGSWDAPSGSGPNGCTTDAAGVCTIERSGIRKKVGSVAYTVTGLGPLAHDAAANHDADGDSDGTTVQASKP